MPPPEVAAYLAEDGEHPHQLLQLLCTQFACCWLAGHCKALQTKQTQKSAQQHGLTYVAIADAAVMSPVQK